MARSGRLRRPGRGLRSEDQSNPKNGPATPLAAQRFRLIVDGWATFRPGACAPPRRTLDDAVSPSTIRLKRASTIAEIRTLPLLVGPEIALMHPRWLTVVAFYRRRTLRVAAVVVGLGAFALSWVEIIGPHGAVFLSQA